MLLLSYFIKFIKKNDNRFLHGWSLASAFLLFVPGIAILTGTRVGKLFGTVGWGVGAIGMAILVAKLFHDWWQKEKGYKRMVLVALIVSLYCGGLLIGYPIQYYCSDNSNASINESIVIAGDWIESQTALSDVLGGDRIAYEVVTGVNMRYVRYDTDSLFYASTAEALDTNLTQYLDTHSVKLFVVNDIVTEYQTVGGSLVPEDNLNNFNEVSKLNKVYMNNHVGVYSINQGEDGINV